MNQVPVSAPKKRPVFLTVLCVIAFVHVGLSIFIGLIGTLASSNPGWFLTSGMLDLFVLAARLGSDKLGLFFSLVLLLLAIISFFGIIQMWNLLKIGVWTFSIPMLLFLIIPFFLIEFSLWYFLVPNLIIVSLLILLFILNYRKMS